MLSLTSVNQAAVSYDLLFRGFAYSDPGEAVIATPGRMLDDVEIVIRETVTGGSASVLATENISGFSIDISRVGSNGIFDDLRVDTAGGDDPARLSPVCG